MEEIIREIKSLTDIEVLKNYGYEEETMGLLKKNLDRENSLYLIAEKEGDFVGFCSIDSDWWERGFCFIREIIVEPDSRKQRIGETLMSKCIDHAKQNGFKGVVTETAFDNIPMQQLCEKLGFKKWNNPQWKEGVTYKQIF